MTDGGRLRRVRRAGALTSTIRTPEYFSSGLRRDRVKAQPSVCNALLLAVTFCGGRRYRSVGARENSETFRYNGARAAISWTIHGGVEMAERRRGGAGQFPNIC